MHFEYQVRCFVLQDAVFINQDPVFIIFVEGSDSIATLTNSLTQNDSIVAYA